MPWLRPGSLWKGEFLLNRDGSTATAQTQTCFLGSLDVASSQAAKAWELRTSASLACLWRRQGHITEARDLLSLVYHWFTEGFDTHDLKHAKALLDELS
jgi:predicted ATPase